MHEHDRRVEREEARRRAREAREAWRRARDDMHEAFRRARDEYRKAQADDAGAGSDVDEMVQEVVESAREFGREVGEEARRLTEDIWKITKREWQDHWQGQLQKSFGQDWRDHWVFGGRRFRQWTGGGEEANPFIASILSRGGGLLALYVLHLLDEQPRHGNEVMRQIESRTMGSWTNNPGAIYPLLSEMEEKDLVRSRWEDPTKRTRRIYQITEEGRAELRRLRRVLRPRLMEAIEVMHILYDDLYPSDEEAVDSQTGVGSSTGNDAREDSPEGVAAPGPTATDITTAPADRSGWRRSVSRVLGYGRERLSTGEAGAQ